MTRFDLGWMNCFTSFISEFIDQQGDNLNIGILLNVAEGAGLTIREIEFAIKNETDKEVINVLREIENELERRKY